VQGRRVATGVVVSPPGNTFLKESAAAARKRSTMLLRHRTPEIESTPIQPSQGLEHLDQKSIAVLRWLNANKVDYVVVGPVAQAIRGDINAVGPVAIVPAPYGRNFERLSSALADARARLRVSPGTAGASGASGIPNTVAIKLNAEKLARGSRWTFRCDVYDIDVEGRPAHRADGSAGVPRYQELLYEAGRFELAAGLSVEAASPEDLEYYAHVRRTGTAPEIRIRRQATEARKTA